MKKISSFILNNKDIILVFVITFFIYMFFGFYINNGDPMASYGFSHAIKNGQIIYKDFNTISTPLYAMYCSLFLHIHDDFVMFILAQTILVTIMFYFIFKTYGNKGWILFLSMIIFKFLGFNATYNFCCLAMLCIIIYLEERHHEKDFLIGLFLGFAFLSKQTVGGLFILPTFICLFKEPKRIIKRGLGFLVPCFILCLYLVFNKALYQFIDLCFLGLFDFGGNNNLLFTIWFFLSCILFITSIIVCIKDRKKITNYYGLMSVGFVLPIFDLNHFAYYFVGFVLMLLPYIKDLSKYKKILVAGLIIEFIVFNWVMGSYGYNRVFYNDINHFKYKYNYELDYKADLKLRKVIDKYIDNDPILIMYYSMGYNISHDRDISYFDVFLYGNHGYNGTKKMIDKIDKMNNQYFIINMEEYNAAKVSDSQFNVDIIDYIVSVSKFVESHEDINVYYKE